MGAARRKVVDRQDAERLLDAWEGGIADLPEFCARVGVDGRSLHCWALNLGRLPREQGAAVGLVEMRLFVAHFRELQDRPANGKS